jgi:7-cyano-7-deazaguanine reductase
MTEGLNLLGTAVTELPKSRKDAVIETFPNPSPGREYWIRLSTREFTSNCPETGQPDFGKICIKYIPDEKCLETKSLKFYLNAYRNESCFNETAVNWITDDLLKACAPKELIVRGTFAPRGGTTVQVETHHPEKESD